MAALLEKDVAKQVRDFMAARGWRAVRTQFAATPGMFSTGEPGMPDYCFIRYMPATAVPARSLVVWCEVKSPNDKRGCRCRPGDKKPCKVCRQKRWHERERALGAVVIVVDDIEWFECDYNKAFGFLHRDEPAAAQNARARQETLPL